MKLEPGTPLVCTEFDPSWVIAYPELVEDAMHMLRDRLHEEAIGTAWEGFSGVMIYTDLVFSSGNYAVTLYPVKPTIATSSG